MKDKHGRDIFIMTAILTYIAQCERVVSRFSSSNELRQDQDAFMIVKGDLEAVGEGIAHLSDEARNFFDQEQIPTASIAGFRNYLAHGYFGFDASFVYPACTADLPPLKKAIKKYLALVDNN
jgi:uncharacterized protein with HEPN domain